MSQQALKVTIWEEIISKYVDDAINAFFLSYSWYSRSIHVSDKCPADGGLQNK